MKRMTERNERKLSRERNTNDEEIKDDLDLAEDELEDEDDLDLAEDELKDEDDFDLEEDELGDEDDLDLEEDELEDEDDLDLAEDELEDEDDLDLEEDDDLDLAEDELEGEDDDLDLAEDELEGEDDDLDLTEDELESKTTKREIKNTRKSGKTIGLTVSPTAKKELDEQLEEFLSTKVKTFSNVGSKGSSFLSVVKAETGTSIRFTKETTAKLNNPTQLSVGFSGSYLVLCNANELNVSSYKGNYKNGRTTVYNTGLVDAIIKEFSLDYSNKTSISFSEGHYKQQGRAILYVKLG